MPKVNVNIQPEIINWAISQTEESRLGETLMNNIVTWLNGTKSPTFRQIEEFSKKANIPLGYFFLQTPPVEKIGLLDYRTVDSMELANPSRDLIDTIHDMERIQEWMKEYRQDTGFDVRDFVGSLKGQNEAVSIAEHIRKDLDLEKEWFRHCKSITDSFKLVRGKLEEIGVVIMLNGIVGKNTHRTLSINEFRAFALVDNWAPLIFINSVDSQGAKLFSLFHEVVHIWLGEDDLFNDLKDSKNVKPIEVLCNKVASELIVPIDTFTNLWNETIEENDRKKINDLAKEFRCSESVIARKALDTNRINKALYADIISEAIEAYRIIREKKTQKGGNYYDNSKTRLDGCFVRALCESVISGRTTLTEACRLTNTSRKTFPEVARRLGGVI